MLGADIFHLNNKKYLCIIDNHSKFPVVKQMEGLSTESLIATTKVIFAEYGIPHRLMSDTGTNYVSEKFRSFWSRLNINQAVLSAYHHQSNGQLKACIKFIKHIIKNCTDSSGDIHMALLQIQTTPLGQGPPSLATLLFSYQVCSVISVIDRKPVSVDSDDEHHIKLIHRQSKNHTSNDASQIFESIPIGSIVAVHWEDRRLWTHEMIIGKGDHNHHNWLYNIQVTTMGRIITHNKQHIKLT